ncbi:MAG: GMC family oxidoreductase [Acidimicrobiaceae bacterium]|nr:GMC family oxidoreductase [Acidimicrobiaceae bacterium]MYG54943.1 GMC family oxidoreductase [Acidimicrobiaceae bacterium]MYJ98567.1 GMC family oxidoreductase [Acidimicrobiaceae bacterium]
MDPCRIRSKSGRGDRTVLLRISRIKMLTDARTLNSGSSHQADVCIIGGGAAGITMAMELLNSDLRVLLLESGGTESDAATQALAQGESIGAPVTSLDNPVSLDQTRLRYLGGTTNHWAGFCRPLSPIDFETRDHLLVWGCLSTMQTWFPTGIGLLNGFASATETSRLIPGNGVWGSALRQSTPSRSSRWRSRSRSRRSSGTCTGLTSAPRPTSKSCFTPTR